jgi:hypothetical protein
MRIVSVDEIEAEHDLKALGVGQGEAYVASPDCLEGSRTASSIAAGNEVRHV